MMQPVLIAVEYGMCTSRLEINSSMQLPIVHVCLGSVMMSDQLLLILDFQYVGVD